MDNTDVQSESPMPYSDDRAIYNANIDSLIKTWAEDTAWKLKTRKILGFLVPLVLLAEILFVAYIVWQAIFYEIDGMTIADYQILISAFSVGIVAQTAYVFNVMVKWLFSDVKYDSHPIINHRK